MRIESRLSGMLRWFLALIIVFASGCGNKKRIENPLFSAVGADSSGLNFSNKLSSTKQFNLFKYMYFYNGAGVGAGDFNNDNRIDLFFASNQGANSLFLNEGGLRFRDCTRSAGIPNDGGWSTGVSVVDINDDGLLDLYICRVGNFESLQSHNQLLVCQGITSEGVPTYADKATDYGLAFSGFSTHAAFLDYDNDGDLDMYLLNHSIHQNGTFGQRAPLLATASPVSGDRLYRNNGNETFTDLTRAAGIHSSVLGYGLGISVADINLDGYPDIYVGNDFHENDYLYINQKDGTFRDEIVNSTMHTSQYSMGVDVADANNDGFPEIVSMDMLPADPYILKRSLGEDTYDLFNLKLNYGYHHQYTRNNLQYNRKNGLFSEIGLYAGIAATDWSWAPLWMDFDNDGLKDLFISNGIPKRMNDIDYISYISDQDVQDMVKDNKMGGSNMALIDKFPQIKIPNKFYKNKGRLAFDDLEQVIDGNRGTYSNGAVYSDFDNDGDLDVVVNNIDEHALLYRNNSMQKSDSGFISIRLQGAPRNRNALGAKIMVYTGEQVRTYENYPAKGFLSSMSIPVHIGVEQTKIDSLLLVWPDNSFQKLSPQLRGRQRISYDSTLPAFDYTRLQKKSVDAEMVLEDITKETGINHRHRENTFVEFDRELLIPNMVSKEGPALAVADINKDGLDDLFIGSSKSERSSVFLQDQAGQFHAMNSSALNADSTYEDVDACWVDVNNDSHVDLVIASGGNEYYGKDDYLLPRVYTNDGKGNLAKLEHAFDGLFVTASCILPYDFNGDGYVDFFIGGRAVPYAYGEIPSSYLLVNNGAGKFSDQTDQLSPGLKKAGLLTDAAWIDMDKDGDKDLLTCFEWGGIDLFVNQKGRFERKPLSSKKGWWNFVLPVDLNGDGNIDIVAGNLGLNSRLKATSEVPVKMYYYDFDGNGRKEQVLTYTVQGKEIPFANKAELDKQMPGLKKRYLYASDFAKASIEELFTKQNLSRAAVFTADYFENAVLINKGNLQFGLRPLPWEGQFSPFKAGVLLPPNPDKTAKVLLAGNFYEDNVEMGRYDADYGSILSLDENNEPRIESVNGIAIKGQIRKFRSITVGGQQAFVYVSNNDSTKIIRLK